jgi:hypothetical protein
MTEESQTKTAVVTVEHIMDFEAATYRSIIRAPRHDGQIVDIEVDRSALLKPAEIKAILADRGADPDCVSPDELRALMEITRENERLMVSKPGWLSNNRFAWPGRTIHTERGQIRFSKGPEAWAQYRPFFQFKSTTEEWRSGVGEWALRSSYMTLGIGVVLAAPLLKFARLSEGGVFHLAGDSGTGKSLSLAVAQSLMGNPKRSLLMSWDATPGGDERLFHSVRDFALAVDDTSRDRSGEAERVRRMTDFVHSAAGGGKRRRAKSYDEQYGAQSARSPILGLSSGEEQHHDLAVQTNQRLAGGARVRLIDVAVPPSSENGVFDQLRDGESAAEVAARLESAIRKTFGRPFRSYFRFLESKFDALPVLVKEVSDAFVRAWEGGLGYVPDASQRRVASKFALVYAGLILGRKAKILDASKSQLMRAVMVCLEANHRPTAARAELIASAVSKLKKRVESEKHFPLLKSGQKRPVGCLGFRRASGRGKVLAYIARDDLAKAAKVQGAMEQLLLAELKRRGAIMKGQGDAGTRQIKVDGGRSRYYVIDPAALS